METIYSHPGGKDFTLKLLEMAKLDDLSGLNGCDLGSGDGVSSDLLRSLGASVIEIEKRDTGRCGSADILHTDIDGDSLDFVLSECAFFSTKDEYQAFNEAIRILKTGGLLLISDVNFEDIEQKNSRLEKMGLELIDQIDETFSWKSYYAHLIWNGQACLFTDYPKDKKASYYLSVYRKK